MTFDDLNNALSDVVASGKIGTPVSLRIHLQIPDATESVNSILAKIIHFGQSIVAGTPSSLVARKNTRQSQLNVILSCAGGQTILATVGSGSSNRMHMQLLLIGNHGIVKLEGEDQLEALTPFHKDETARWESAINQSIQEAAQIPLTVE